MQENSYSLGVMDQNLVDDNFSESVVNEDVPLRSTNNDGENSYKCNKCKYTSSVKNSLRSHLKMHGGKKLYSGEKSKKCNQCDFASAHATALRRHFENA